MPCAPAYPYQLLGHPSEKALEAVLAMALDEQLDAPARIAAARLLVEDRNYKERLCLDEQKRLDQKERADHLQSYRETLTLHRKQGRHLESRRVRLGFQRYRLAKKNIKLKASSQAQARVGAASRQPAPQAGPGTAPTSQPAIQPLPIPALTPVSPSPSQEERRKQLGIPRGGVQRQGASAWYYKDKPELLAQLEKEDQELAEIREQNQAAGQAAQYAQALPATKPTLSQPIASAMGTAPETDNANTDADDDWQEDPEGWRPDPVPQWVRDLPGKIARLPQEQRRSEEEARLKEEQAQKEWLEQDRQRRDENNRRAIYNMKYLVSQRNKGWYG